MSKYLSRPYTIATNSKKRNVGHNTALQNGARSTRKGSIFRFEEQLLPQLLTAALSGRPALVYYTDGLKRLKAHDDASQVSYLDTLRVYLEHNQSVTRTAEALFLHRSTLLDRLAHITQLLGGDLKDPSYSLTLRIVLQAEAQQRRNEALATSAEE